MFFNTTFKATLLLIISFELFSFCGYLWPVWNKLIFVALVLLFLIICLKRLDFGVYILLAELFIGSKGYLFYYDFGGFAISIRIAFWLIIIGVWLFGALEYYVRSRHQQLLTSTPSNTICGRFFKSRLFYYFIAWFVVIGLGLVMGFARGNSFNNIFDDFNAYLFFGLILVFYDVIVSKKQIRQILGIFAAALTVMSLKTIGLLYFFSHGFSGIPSLYRWVRTSGVGEITNMGGSYYRIFFQSHIFVIIGFVIFLVFLLFNNYHWNLKNFLKGMFKKFQISNFKFQNKFHPVLNTEPNSIYQFSAVIILLAATILISLSRSFWVGLIGGLIIVFVYYLISDNFNYIYFSPTGVSQARTPAEKQVKQGYLVSAPRSLGGDCSGAFYKKFIIYFLIIFAWAFYIFFIYSAKYYLGLFLSVLILFYFLIKILKFSKRKVYTFTSLMVIVFLLGVGLINNVVKFPWPGSSVNVQLGEMISDRAIIISGDAATSSRWDLLKALKPKIMEFPTILVGSGFGSTITYKSSDPRILAADPSGFYTTYAFEWGYLDIWLKLGIIGLAVYLGLILKLFFEGLSYLKKNSWKIESDESRLILGFLLGLIIVIIIHCFTPYLNHPLGIGYLLLCAVVFGVFKN